MLPAVSALDCLVADLGIDPATTGLQSYEATDFIVHRRRPDTAATLVLWQIGVVGELGYARAPRRENLAPLVADPFVLRLPFEELPDARVPLLATLVVPPARKPRRDRALTARLGLS